MNGRRTRWPRRRSAQTAAGSPPAAGTASIESLERRRRAAGRGAPRSALARATTSASARRNDRVVSAGDDGTVADLGRRATPAWAVPSYTDDLDFSRDGRSRARRRGRDGEGLGHGQRRARSRRCPDPAGYVAPKFSPADRHARHRRKRRVAGRIWPVRRGRAQGRRPAPARPRDRVRGLRRDGAAHRVRRRQGRRSSCATCASGREVTLGGARRRSPTPSSVPTASTSRRSPRAATSWSGASTARPPGALAQGPPRTPRTRWPTARDGRLVTAGADRTVRVWDPAAAPAVVHARPRRRGHDRRLHGRRQPGAQLQRGRHAAPLGRPTRGAALAVLQSEKARSPTSR